jgi:predicted DNA repair protein MutK
MSTGLIALLDDVAAIAKVAAASLDDVAGQALKAGAKSAGVVIDDAAVTPRYVVGFAAEREIPIVARIAKGSLRNKLLFLLPAALALGLAVAVVGQEQQETPANGPHQAKTAAGQLGFHWLPSAHYPA